MLARMKAWLALALVLGSSARADAKGTRVPRVQGLWDTPQGRVALARHGSRVTGVLVEPVAGSPLGRDQKVLEGTFYQDNLTARVRLGLVAKTCGKVDRSGFVVLLLTRSGKLTGSLASRERCAAGVDSVLFVRSKDQSRRGRQARAQASPEPPDEGLDRGHPPRAAVSRLLGQGLLLMQAGRYEEARKLFLEATRLSPHRGEAYNGVGATYAMREDYETAVRWYKTGLENAPGFSDLYFNLACAYAQMDQKEMAFRYLELAARKGYGQAKMLDDSDLDPLRKDPRFEKIETLMRNPSL